MSTSTRLSDYSGIIAWRAAEMLVGGLWNPALAGNNMGHASLASTDYYLHLVPEFFPTFAAKVRATEGVLPEVDHDQG